VPIRVEVVPSPEQTTANQEKERREDAKFRIERFTAIFVFIYATVAIIQWRETHNTYIEIQKQTKTQRQEIVGTFAAAIPNEPPAPREIGDDINLLHDTGIGVNFRNVGKVKATHFYAIGTMMREQLPGYKAIGSGTVKESSKSQLRPYEQNGQGFVDTAYLSFDTLSFTKEDLTRLHHFREVIEINGYFQYEDGFENKIHEPMCFIYVAVPRHIYPASGTGTGGGPGGWFLCQDGKERIDNALRGNPR